MADLKLSLCMIVKNEEQNLKRCLQSVEKFVDEIIIVDTGSTDCTIEIAKQYNAHTFQTTWRNDFSFARNVSLGYASGDWILVLDADEVLDQKTATFLKPLLSQTNASGLRVIQKNLLPAGELIRYRNISITRVFRNDASIRFEGQIHESVQPSIFRIGGEIEESRIIILHDGYAQTTVQGGNSRGQRNLDLLEQMLLKNPSDAYLHYQLGITHKHLQKTKQAVYHLKKALSLDQGDLSEAVLDEILMKLAQIALSEKRDKDCVRYAIGSLKHAPDNILSMYLAALGYMGINQVDKAYPYFLQIRQSPEELLTDIQNLDVMIKYCRDVLNK